MVQAINLLAEFWGIHDPWVHLPDEQCGRCGDKTERESGWKDMCLGICSFACRWLRALAGHSQRGGHSSTQAAEQQAAEQQAGRRAGGQAGRQHKRLSVGSRVRAA